MTKTNQPRQRVEESAAAVRAAREVLKRWEHEAAAAHDGLEQLQRDMGPRVLDDPAQAQELTRSMQALRDRISVAESAAAAARPRVLPAERAYLAAEADLVENTQLAEVSAALAKHDARTNELLAQLEAHEGRYVLEFSAQLQAYDPQTDGPRHFTGPKSGPLRESQMRLERHVLILREMAAGQDPKPLMRQWDTHMEYFNDYPACVWGPDALVPAGDYVASLDRARRMVEELDEALAALPEEIAQLEQAWRDQGRVEPRPDFAAREAAMRENIEAQRAVESAQLVALTGE